MKTYILNTEEIYSKLRKFNKCERFKKIVKGQKAWYVGCQPNEADEIYVGSSNPEEEHTVGLFRGFGGATLQFKLEDGTIDNVKGPWHSNPDALLQSTGYDVRNKSLTWGCISKHKSYEPNDKVYGGSDQIFKDLIYIDDDPVIGEYTRIEKLAQEYANKLNMTIYYHNNSCGGSQTGCKKPKNNQ